MTAVDVVLDMLVALAGGVAAFGLTLTAIARARHTRPYDLLRDAPLPPAPPRRRQMGERGPALDARGDGVEGRAQPPDRRSSPAHERHPMTTTTLPRTPRPMDYLADALLDHNRRHDGNADAVAHELALVLAALAPDPGWINAVTDALDRLGPNPPALAGTDLDDDFADALSAVIDGTDEGDDAPPVAPFGLRYRVTFERGRHGEARIGRTYNVPPLDVEIGARTDVIAGLANAVHNYARPKLLSADVDVHVNPTPMPGTYRITVYAGVAIGATATAVAQFPDADEDPAR